MDDLKLYSKTLNQLDFPADTDCENIQQRYWDEIYLRRVRKVAQSKLKEGKLIQTINTWAMQVIRYAGG